MLCRTRNSFAKAFEPSSCAAILRGPKQRRPSLRKRSTSPATSGASGPTTVSATSSFFAKASNPSMSFSTTSALRTPGSRAVPALPGATMTSPTRLDCLIFHASACSRPPEPMTRTFTNASSVAEVAYAGEHHRHAVFIGGGYHFLVAHRPARLDHGADSVLGGRIDAVAEGKECVGRHHGAMHVEFGFGCFDARDLRADHAAHLSGADADGAAFARVDDRIGFHEHRHVPREQQIAQFVRVRHTLGDDFQIRQQQRVAVGILNE